MKHLRALLVILFVLLVIVIAVQNYQQMATKINFKVDLLFFRYESAPMSVYLIAIISFLLGVIFSGLYGVTERFRLKRQIRYLMKESKEKDEELNSLRNLPVTSEDVSPEKASDLQ
jgi:ATP adenylyltransferase